MMIKRTNDNGKPSCRKPISLINVTSLLVVVISLFFAYHYFVPAANRFDNVDDEKRSEESSEQSLAGKTKEDGSCTFIDKFKQRSDLLAFVRPVGPDVSFSPAHVDQFNNKQLLPRLLSIVDMDYFKYIKLNLNKKCTLWPDDAKCSRRDCSIQICDESRLPDYIVNTDDEMREHHGRQSKEEPNKPCNEANTTSELDQIVNVISNETLSTMNELFECYVSEYEDGQFYDLKTNPEQFTGYQGPTAHRIWRSIYEENCFKSKKIHQLTDQTETNANNAQLLESILNVDDLCLEEKIFYRAISGLHTSINIHLSRYYHFRDGSIGFNLKEFLKRFEGESRTFFLVTFRFRLHTTLTALSLEPGKNEYLKNLYFVFLLELRALHKAGSYLLTKVNWQSSGDQAETRDAIKDVLKVIGNFGWRFDEDMLNLQAFRNAEFAEHFHNISTTIMDCVACDKCKLWGKVQTHALGTAFKILLTDFNNKVQFNKFHLHRHEISTLFNGITRLSNSINSLEQFNRMIREPSAPVTSADAGSPKKNGRPDISFLSR